MKCNGFGEENYGLYALGSGSKQTRSEIEEHLRGNCETCVRELVASTAIWHAVALETDAGTPTAKLRRNVVGIFDRKPAPRIWRWALVSMAAAAAMTLAFTAGWSWRAVKSPVNDAIVFSPRVAAPSTIIPPAPEPKLMAQVNPQPRLVAPDEAELNTLRQELQRERAISAQLSEQIASASKPIPPAPAPAVSPDRQIIDAATAESQDLRSKLSATAKRVEVLERELNEAKALLELQRKRAEGALSASNVITGPSLRVIPLKGTERGPRAGGRVLIGSSQMLFVGTNFPALPSGRVYQLWLIRSNAPAIASAGTFRPDTGGSASIRLDANAILSGVTAVSVTDEPVGGSQQPTGSKWVIGM